MSNVSRVCPHCGEQSSLESRFCTHCGQSSIIDPRQDKSASLSVPLRTAAFPIVVGAVGFLAKVGWKLLQSKVARDVAFRTANNVIQSNLQKDALVETVSNAPKLSEQSLQSGQVTQKPKRTIRINSKWAVGDAHGITRQGQSEHIIEIDD